MPAKTDIQPAAKTQKYHFTFWALIILAVSLTLRWEIMVNIAQFLLFSAWLAEANFKNKLARLKKHKAIIFSTSVFWISVAGLAHTQNFDYALHDLRIKTPLLALPVLVGTMRPLSQKQFKLLLQVIVASIVFTSLFHFLQSKEIMPLAAQTASLKETLPFSHIRFSLYTNVAIFILAYLIFSKKKHATSGEKALCAAAMLWLVTFLFLLQALTGLIILALMALLIGIFFTSRIENMLVRIFSRVMVLTLALMAFSYLAKTIDHFYQTDQIVPDQLDTHTAQGNPYGKHPELKGYIENGHHVGVYVCQKEMKKHWNRRSNLKYNGKDHRGQSLRFTLMRYLTSKNLRKDSSGIAKLSEQDIQNIENGYANHIYLKPYNIDAILYKIIWQIDFYKKFGNPNGHSITQRIEFLKAGIAICKENFWIGVGTGDVPQAFEKQYEKMNSPLNPDKRFRTHNQFVTFFVAFGLLGFVLIFIPLLYAPFLEKAYSKFLFSTFFIAALLSFLNEDTLETQAGVIFFAFFYSIFMFFPAKGQKN